MTDNILSIYNSYKELENKLDEAIQKEFPVGSKVKFTLQRKDLLTTYDADVVTKENDRPGYITVYNNKTKKSRSIHAPEMLAIGRLEKVS